MPDSVKGRPNKRRYQSALRAERADATRAAILRAARELFLRRGWTGTTMSDIARAATVSPDTVYASVGRKEQVFTLLLEQAISGSDAPAPAEARDYVRRIRAEADAEGKLRTYALALTEIHPRLAPLMAVARAAGPGQQAVTRAWRAISDRRAANMRLLAADLHSTGRLRADLSLDEVADVIWATNSPELWTLLVTERGWTPERYADWLTDTWVRTLLEPA
jgi:AcrR family transcriptional regulator